MTVRASAAALTGAAPGLPAYLALADTLRSQILAGRPQPGDRLPVEPELCAMYGVSRSTVREALRVLSSQGLVATTRGVSGGSFVQRPQPSAISDYLQNSLTMITEGAGSVAQLVEVRELLEVPAARLAARRRDEDDVSRLKATLIRPRDVDPTHRFEANRNFHTALLDAAGNPLLAAVARPVFHVLNERFTRDKTPQRVWQQVFRDHREITDRVAAGDETGAEQASYDHLERLRGLYERLDRRASH